MEQASAALARGYRLIDDLMPGIGHLALQDYRIVNEAPIEMQAAKSALDRLLASA